MRARSAAIAIALLIVLALVRALIATRTDGFTIDEPWHIIAGAFHLRSGDYRMNPEQPPFVKLVAAAAVPDLKLPPIPQLGGKAGERRFIDTVMFLDNDPDVIQQRVRIAMSMMNGLLLLLLAVAVWRTFDPAVSVAALLFLAIDPSVAANIPVVMTDLPVALAGASAALFTVAALARRNVLDLCLAIVSFAVAIGAKHSGPLVAVTLAIVCVVVLAITRHLPRLKFALASTLILFAAAWALLWAMYGFRYLETSDSGDRTNTALAVKIGDVHSPLIRSGLNLAAAAHAVPRAYIWGLADTVRAGVEGRGIPVVFLGTRYRDRGPFYQWPVVIAAKLPLGLTVLVLLGMFTLIRYGTRSSWRLPLAALAVLSAVFLFFMIRGAAYGGVRHALPLFPPLAVIAAIGCAELTARRSRLGASAAALAIVIAAASAIPAIRPWEYYNEIFGGASGAYRHFADEGIDVGQRTKDLARYCTQQLASHDITPYVLYPISPQEEKFRGIRIHSNRTDDVDHSSDDPLVTGTFLVHAKAVMRNDEIRALRDIQPSGRVGNLLIYTGTYRLPALRIGPLRRKIEQIMRSDRPNFGKAEGYLYRLIKIDPEQPGAYVHLGNINLARHATAAALGFYSTAALQVQDPELRAILQRQIDLLKRDAWESLKPIRLPERE